MKLLRALLPLAFVASCATAGLHGETYQDGDVRYRVVAPGEGWREVNVRQANVAWMNADLGASMLVNSHCAGVQDAPLEALAGHLLIGMTDREIVGARTLQLSRREALEQEVSARLDGVPRRMMVLVLKKDGCVYDIVLDSTPESFDRARPSYERVRDAFDVEPRKDWI